MTGFIKVTVRAGYAEVGMVKGITQPHSSFGVCACVDYWQIPSQ